MSATYNDTLPTDRDRVRAIIGATDVSSEAAALVSDEHIDAVLDWKQSLDGAVSFIAGELASQYAQQPGSVRLPSGLAVSWSDRVKRWSELAASAASGGITNTASVTQVPVIYNPIAVRDEFSR